MSTSKENGIGTGGAVIVIVLGFVCLSAIVQKVRESERQDNAAAMIELYGEARKSGVLQYATDEELAEMERLSLSINDSAAQQSLEDVGATARQNLEAIRMEQLYRQHERLQKGR